jgi:SAM-dependent methyltransferase
MSITTRKHGAIRGWLETLKFIAQFSGLSLEQVADVFDANEAVKAKEPASTDASQPPTPPTSGRGAVSDLAAIREHWNERATLGATAGTQDLMLQQLEQRAILDACKDIPEPCVGLEIGCGTGDTARLLVRTYPRLDLLAVDNARGMLLEASKAPFPAARLRFRLFDALALPQGRFDLIVTQRMLINLPTWELQKRTLDAIAERLAPGGRYVMCEHAQGGLDAINETRTQLGLPVIQAPWHNRYIRHQELADVRGMALIETRCFSAEYYFLSRIVNAKLAQDRGETPRYDDPLNALARELPQGMMAGRYAQGRVWIWKKP